MNVAGWLSSIIALLGISIAGVVFLVTTAPRAKRLRSLIVRMCVQLSPEQRVGWPNEDLGDCRHLIREDVDALTAMEFLDDEGAQRSILDRIGEMSPSLFHGSSTRFVTIGAFIALLFGPAFLGMVSVLWPFTELLGALAKVPGYGIPLIVGGAVASGILFGVLGAMIAWRIFFERDVQLTMQLIEGQPLWASGAKRRPANRKFVAPKDDPSFAGLKR